MRPLLLLLTLVPAPAFATASGRAAQEAEIRSMAITYAIACVALVLALGGAKWLASRR
ncbi:hypothetical protein [Enterovirga sp.]|uniref:hypothetical protein n=1 Tax=Enterovirga sp. TaxID=2026350 RepID=UPI002BADAFCD|nr:hypothetical protein [Enterovirga sp.]HMO30543.1 hypothetical protein [Enterovirga sp.]